MHVALLGQFKNTANFSIESTLKAEGYQVNSISYDEAIEHTVDVYGKARDNAIGADAVVADVSVLEKHIRHQLAMALEIRRPTLLVVPATHPDLGDILALKNRNLTTETYRTNEELAKIILKFVDHVKNTLDAKLFMNIPPSMNRYLDWVATYTQYSKSDVVRDAVEKAAQADKAYQDFLKSLDR